jgi:hypothetical protein
MPSERLFYSRMKSRVELSFLGLFGLFLILVGAQKKTSLRLDGLQTR